MADQGASEGRQVTRVTLEFDRELSEEEIRQLQAQHDAVNVLVEPPLPDDHDHDHNIES